MPLVTTIFTVLNTPVDTRDTVTLTDKKLLRRGYFIFIANLVNSDLTQVIKSQGNTTIAMYRILFMVLVVLWHVCMCKKIVW